MTPEERLDQVRQDVEQWRLTQPRRNAAFPADLRQAALRLLADFPVSRVARALGIGSSSIYLWRKPAAKSTPQSKVKPAAFIQIPAAFPAEPARTLSFQVAQDVQLTLQGELPAEYVVQLVTGLRA